MKTTGTKRKLKWIFEIIGILTLNFFLEGVNMVI